jgi:hypothetical protein
VINAVIGFLPGLNINWRAHLGGLLVGALLTFVMVYAPQRTRLLWSIGASVAMFVVLAGVTMYRTSEIRDCAAISGVQEQRSCVDDLTLIG